ncbi:MAG: DUF4123 domain-containing protein [Luteimonas sp.]|nr:DUF4123 domain-containing protein [Luteimonas sp.]
MIVELDHRLFLAQDYALINPMQVGKEQYADLNARRLLPKGMERHERMLPLLVHLASLNESQRIELLERTEQWARHYHMPLFSALFSSQYAPDRVNADLLVRVVLRRASGQRAWLRYHDPRVFRHLQWLLDKEQLAALMGPAQTWLGFDPLCRHWHQWPRPDVSGHPRLRLDAGQWQAVAHFEALNHCLRDLADEGEASDDDTARALLDGLLEARQQGLAQSMDAMLYARQRLEHGPGMSQLPAVALRLRQTREYQTSYVAACDTLSIDDFLRPMGAARSRTKD